MLFNSFAFAIFLPVVFAVYWVLPHRFRWVVMFIASYYFYMSWNVKYVVLILFTTVISYLCAIFITKAKSKRIKKVLLASTLTASLGVLFFFKYFNFFSESITEAFRLISLPIHPVTLSLMLPVGISFYTFQTLSYVIDVYRGSSKPEKHFGIYATFIAFFPQLVAGPIERTNNLLPQIKEVHKFNYTKATYGLKLMAWGFFKKIVIADTLAVYVDQIYNHASQFSGFSLLAATVFFAFQIYCDFSGYSDIAIGAAKLFDIDLMTNFKSPYLSSSIKEFWSRWHISLSSWFRDYVYIPLGGNRVGRVRHRLNLLITFLISGLWHGASWTFVIWGGLHGIGQIAENIAGSMVKAKKKQTLKGFSLLRVLKICAVFVFCCFAWIFFRSNTLTDATYIIGHMFDGIAKPIDYLFVGFKDMGFSKAALMKAILIVAVLLVYDFLALRRNILFETKKLPTAARWAIYWVLIVAILLLMPGQTSEFIYFDF